MGNRSETNASRPAASPTSHEFSVRNTPVSRRGLLTAMGLATLVSACGEPSSGVGTRPSDSANPRRSGEPSASPSPSSLESKQANNRELRPLPEFEKRDQKVIIIPIKGAESAPLNPEGIKRLFEGAVTDYERMFGVQLGYSFDVLPSWHQIHGVPDLRGLKESNPNGFDNLAAAGDQRLVAAGKDPRQYTTEIYLLPSKGSYVQGNTDQGSLDGLTRMWLSIDPYALTNDKLLHENTLLHELGHANGLGHTLTPSGAPSLMDNKPLPNNKLLGLSVIEEVALGWIKNDPGKDNRIKTVTTSGDYLLDPASVANGMVALRLRNGDERERYWVTPGGFYLWEERLRDAGNTPKTGTNARLVTPDKNVVVDGTKLVDRTNGIQIERKMQGNKMAVKVNFV